VTDAMTTTHQEVLHLMRSGDWRAADETCKRLIDQYPTFAVGWLAASHIAMALGTALGALDAIDRAVALEPANPNFLIHRAQCLLALGRRADAMSAADAAERCRPSDPNLWDAIGTLRSYATDQQRALAAYDRAVALAPQNSQFVYNRASVRRFLGDLEGAESDYDRVIALKPSDYEAYVNRAELRVQTETRNHISQLEILARQNIADWRGEVQVRFALAKEYEDLSEYAKSFEHLRYGARRQRQHMHYDVATDVATVGWIIDAFPTIPTEAIPGASKESPIFIVGLPRSGTTMLERMLGSHSSVTSAGELDCFGLAIVEAVRRCTGRSQVPRKDLVALSATLDFAGLGRDYLASARAACGSADRFIDKMPLNYLYCGLIRRALPNSKIVHMTRHPMAVCYAMYKTLFKNGYPFSYDLGEIARYYIAYRRLMHHWEAAMPGVMRHVSYENLVANQTGEARKLLRYCGLDWEERCVTFHQNPASSTTASASQVRRPLYTSSVSQWRHYEIQLAELSSQLREAGLDLGTNSPFN
jgi:tetratricopeptide (TPR) repeat protein